MTTGRINQVATIRFEAGSAEAHQHEVRKCVWNFDCVLASVSQLSCTTAPLQRLHLRRGAAGKAGSAASALARSNLCPEHRRAALSDAFD